MLKDLATRQQIEVEAKGELVCDAKTFAFECMLCNIKLEKIWDYEKRMIVIIEGFKTKSGICSRCGGILHGHFMKSLQIEFFYKRLNAIEKMVQDHAAGVQRVYDILNRKIEALEKKED